MNHRSMVRPHWEAFVALVGAIIVLDQAAKAWISSELGGGRVIVFLDGALRLVYTENSGALFGMFKGQVSIFGLLSLAVIGLIVAFHARSGRNAYMTLTLGLLLGGAIGNAVDRFRLGYVVDFVDGGLGTTRFFTFNLADACISAAIVLLFAMALRPSLAGESSRPDLTSESIAPDAGGDRRSSIAEAARHADPAGDDDA